MPKIGRHEQIPNLAVRRRFQVSQGHELRQRLRLVPVIAAALILVSGATVAIRYPDHAAALLALNGLASLILLTFRPLAGLASPRGIVGLALLMPAVASGAMAATMAVDPATFATTMAALAIIPIGVPLLLAWDAQTNRRWAVAYGLAVGLLALLTGFGDLSVNQRLDVASLVAMCCVVGVLAGNLLQDLRLRTIEQELELRRLNRVLHNYATTDPLTDLGNRRQLDADVARVWAAIHHGSAPCAVVMLDLDHFKRLNDERGHPAGDATLRSVAMELKRQVWGKDSVYRIGGEEFLVLLPETTLDGALHVAERIRAAIYDLGLPSTGAADPEPLTISGGVSVAGTPLRSWEIVVAAADAALYAAKEGGRNRVFGPHGALLLAA
jgi:diguanylate cyclase (GGDEF)-like protein